MKAFEVDLERTARVPRETSLPAVLCVVTDALTALVLRDRLLAGILACAALLAPPVVLVETLALMAPAASAQDRGRSPREPRVALVVLVEDRVRSAREPRVAAPQSLQLWLASLFWLVLQRYAWLSSSLLRRSATILRP